MPHTDGIWPVVAVAVTAVVVWIDWNPETAHAFADASAVSVLIIVSPCDGPLS